MASSMTGLAFLAATILACTSGESAMFMNLCARSALVLPFMMAMVSTPSTAPSLGIATLIGTPWPIM
ncbi:hypothetical protein D3C71_1505750 [compost metagenome]